MKIYEPILLLVLFLLFALGGCSLFEGGSLDNISAHERIILVDDAITGSAAAAVIALEEGYITVKEACVVHEYGRMAAVIVDQAWTALFQQDNETVDHYLAMARETLAGVSEEAQTRADYHCAGVA